MAETDSRPFDEMVETFSHLLRTLACAEVGDVPVGSLGQLVLLVERCGNALHAFSSMLLDRFEHQGDWAVDGAMSAVKWAAERTGGHVPAVRARVCAGAALRQLPVAGESARRGLLSPEHLRGLADCVRRHPDLARRDEAVLVGQAETLDPRAFNQTARYWCDRADAAAPAQSEAVGREVTEFVHLSETLDGLWRLDGQLGPENGKLLFAALEAQVDRALRRRRDQIGSGEVGDASVPVLASQMRAQALTDLCAQAARRSPCDDSVPDRYRVAVVLSHEEWVDGRHVAACDSAAYRVVHGPAGEVLDVGRESRRWPRGIRRAITSRDRGCVFPGCDRPPSWTDVHHCQPWEQGGTTRVDNGALLCRRHHVFIHHKGWTISIPQPGGRPETRRPDGTLHRISRNAPAGPTIQS